MICLGCQRSLERTRPPVVRPPRDPPPGRHTPSTSLEPTPLNRPHTHSRPSEGGERPGSAATGRGHALATRHRRTAATLPVFACAIRIGWRRDCSPSMNRLLPRRAGTGGGATRRAPDARRHDPEGGRRGRARCRRPRAVLIPRTVGRDRRGGRGRGGLPPPHPQASGPVTEELRRFGPRT